MEKVTRNREVFPDGTAIDEWFYETKIPQLADFRKIYSLTDYQIFDDGKVYTEKIQNLIDAIASEGGGVLFVPKGTFCTGALFFKQGVHLYLSAGGTIKGSDDISDYPLCQTRIEGESCLYYPALINADGVDGFTIFGEGTIDGNGLRFWKAFWQRLQWNPKATNKDEQRPRLVYISNAKNALVTGVRLQNSAFWTNHLYKCKKVKFLGCEIIAPIAPVPAPSSDALDIDACEDILVKNCRIAVSDDAVALKGGKGPWADEAVENGGNERILIEDCTVGHCHSCLTCGSESIHNKNILVRRIKISDGYNLLWLKMRPDTPQNYEYITIENIEGRVSNFININPWTQFFDLKGRESIPLSYASNIVMQNCKVECDRYFSVTENREQYRLSNFSFENLDITAGVDGFVDGVVENMKIKNTIVQIKA